MRKLIALSIIILLISCKSKKPITEKSPSEVVDAEKPMEVKSRFVKLKSSEINTLKLNKTYALGKRLLETCNTSKFKQFSKEEATDKVIQNATVEKISKTCQKILVRNGKFIDLSLIEIIQDTETKDIKFRYKIVYEKKYFERELYITLNSEGKISEIKTKELPKKPM